MDAAEEALLVSRAKAGDADAIGALLERYQGPLYRFSMRMCGDREDASEVLQESLLAAARGLSGFRGDAKFSSWLYAIARRSCIKHRRRGKSVAAAGHAADASELVDPAPTPDQRTADRQLHGALEAAIAELEPGYREVLLLRDVEGLRAAEVAEALALSVPQVKSRLHRARVAVRERIASYREQPGTGGGRQRRSSAPAPAPASSQCPEIAETFSRYLEGEISPTLCSRMQAHVDACDACRKTCDSLRDVLATCHALPTPDVPEEVVSALRREIRGLRAERGG